MVKILRYRRGRCERCEDPDACLGVEVEHGGKHEFLCTAHLWEVVREECVPEVDSRE
jgi:hypothetical protein